MPCNNPCCPPHEFFATRDPLPSDCQDSVVPGYETEGGYCTGSYWRNTVTGQIFIGIDDMACNTATWMPTNNLLVNLAHVRISLGAYQSIPSNTSTRLEFLNNVDYDSNTDWDAGNHEFITPRDGYYRITAATAPANALDSTTGWVLGDSFFLLAMVNNVLLQFSGIGNSFLYQHSTGASQTFVGSVQNLSTCTLYLTAGDIFHLNIVQKSSISQEFSSTKTRLWIDELPSYGVLP